MDGSLRDRSFWVVPKESEPAGGSTLAGLEGKKIKITGTIEL
jgi:hypothetical protein